MPESIPAPEPDVTEPSGEPFALPPEEDASLRLWWHVLRPERLRIADEIDRCALDYRRVGANEAETALIYVARWLRASAGEVGPDPAEHAAEKLAHLFAASSSTTESGGE